LRANSGPYTDDRWIIVVFLALMLISWFSPALQKLGFGKLPGDLRFKPVRARDVHSPHLHDPAQHAVRPDRQVPLTP
jgi:hypothetical protein